MDIEISGQWYENVPGLERYQLDKWRDYPLFLLAGVTSVAIFPADTRAPATDKSHKYVSIDHFAFIVSVKEFANARKRYKELGISYEFKDHFYFHSIYTLEPDGHIVQLTTLVVNTNDFYKN